ncbi:MAG: T9SS type A sorting domain-containing protein [Bacteroidetes bacterium]|jgi:hypothetical protein|nr:T9SS type A sorting domain-containing protein [Bacteroidota bacterium]
MHNFIQVLIVVAAVNLSGFLKAQTDFIPTAGETETFTPAEGDFFYDPGGPSDNYPNCDCVTTTTLDGVFDIEFASFEVFATFDWLKIYDGAGTGGTVLYDNSTGGANEGDLDLADMIMSNGSAAFTGSAGALTFEFSASSVVNDPGWEVEVLTAGAPSCDITCPADTFVSNDSGECGAFVDIPVPTTDCGAAEMFVLLSEDFSGGSLPAGWSVEKDGDDASGDIGDCGAIFSFDCTDDQFFSGLDPSFDGNFATIDDDAAGFGEESVKSIITEEIDLSEMAVSKSLSYSYSFDQVGGSDGLIDVWDGTDWVNVQTISSDGFGVSDIDISAYNNEDFKVRFSYDDLGGWSWGLQIDNVEVSVNQIVPGSAVIVNDFNGADDASDFYPVGTTEVTFSVEGNPGVICTISVTVEDNEGPVLDCPSDQTINLTGGECDAIFNFDVGISDNCQLPRSSLNLTQNDDTTTIDDAIVVCGNQFGTGETSYFRVFDVSNLTETEDLQIDGFKTAFIVSQDEDYDVSIHTISPADYSLGDLEFDLADLNTINTETINIPVVNDDYYEVGLDPVMVPQGTDFMVFEFRIPDAGFNGQILLGPNDAPESNPTYILDCDPAISSAVALETLVPTPQLSWGLIIRGSLDAEAVQIAGPPSGTVLDPGETDYEFEIEDGAGNVATCGWTVTVEELANPSQTLVCNDHVNVTVDENCEAVINADMVLEGGPYACYRNYIVELATDMDFNNIISSSQPGDEGAVVGSGQVGETYFVRVIDPETGNTCWGEVTIEDKLIPELNCNRIEVDCGADLTPGNSFTSAEVLVEMTFGSGTFDGEVGWEVINTNTNEVVFCEEAGAPAPSTDPQVLSLNDGDTYEVYGYDSFGDGWNGASILFEDVATGDQLFNSIGPVDGESNTCDGTQSGGPDLLGSFTAVAPVVTVNVPTGGDPVLIDENTYVVSGFDPCGDVTASYVDDVMDIDDCDSELASRVFRNWTVVDGSGNTTTCQDTIEVLRSSLEDITFPPNFDGNDQPALACDGENWDLNGNGYPDPEETGAPDAQICDNLLTTSKDHVIEVCEGTFKILRDWTFIDWCTSETVEFQQLIKVEDTEGPEVVCPPTATISTGANSCIATYSVPDITGNITDECSPSDVSWTVESSAGEVVDFGNQVFQIINLPIGTHTLTYTAFDGCGNEGTCEQTIIVRDEIPPVAVCDQNTKVALGVDGTARVFWPTFEDGSYDNCGIDRIEVRRMDRESDCEPNTFFFKEFVEFCCADLDRNPVQVLFRVTDESGNQNTCMINVTVEDKLPPAIVAPRDLTLSCNYPFDLWNLEEFGEVANQTAGEVRQTRRVFDEEYERDCLDNNQYDPEVPTYEFLDGFAQDNCSLEISSDYNDQRDDCGIGTLIRTFRAVDADGNANVAFQSIEFERCTPFTENSIIWPLDQELECDENGDYSTDPEATGEPEFDDVCSQIAVRFDDEVFEVTPDACFKILRHWTVIDWCQFDEETGAGEFTYTQVIKVNDSQAPELLACDDVTFCDSSAVGCMGFAELVQEVEDCTPDSFLNVTWRVKPFNAGNNPNDDIVGTGLDASGMYPFGTHRITWIVEDMCGNVGTCQYLFTVEDCKLPTPVVINGLATVVMPSSGCIDVNVDLFDAGSFDNCGPVQFSYSADVDDTIATFCCEDGLGTKEIEFWVTDAVGNQDFVITSIRIQDPNGFCGDPSQPTISGTVESSAQPGKGVERAEMKLENTSAPTPLFRLTSADGEYAFFGAEGESYSLNATKNDDVLNGVSTFDILMIQRHILGIEILSDPYQLIAANVNDDARVSGADIIELRKVILGIETSFPNNQSWRFVDAAETLEEGQLPRQYKESIAIYDLNEDLTDQDFIGVKIGDINGNADPNNFTSQDAEGRNGALVWEAEEAILESGQTHDLMITSAMFDNVSGYQMTWNTNGVEIEEVISASVRMESSNYAVFDDYMTMSWHKADGLSTQDNEALFIVRITATEDVRLSDALSISSEITPAEAYVGEDIQKVDLRFNNAGPREFALYQNVPNPFESKTMIRFDLPEAGNATLTVFDGTGKVVKEINGDYKAGSNKLELLRSDLPGHGLLYYRLESGDYVAVKKMILME